MQFELRNSENNSKMQVRTLRLKRDIILANISNTEAPKRLKIIGSICMNVKSKQLKSILYILRYKFCTPHAFFETIEFV